VRNFYGHDDLDLLPHPAADAKSTHLIGFSRKRALVLPPATALRVDPKRTTEEVIEGGNAIIGAQRFFDDTSNPDQTHPSGCPRNLHERPRRRGVPSCDGID
jgi:hypothetical protein